MSENNEVQTVQGTFASMLEQMQSALRRPPELPPDTPELLRAAVDCDLARVDALLATGIPVNQAGPNGGTALMLASQTGNAEAVRYLLARGADPNRLRESGHGALALAAMRGHVEVVRLLLDAGAIVVPTGTGTNPFWAALNSGKLELVELLLGHGADPNGYENWSPLRDAALLGSPELVRCLLRAGADPNRGDSLFDSPLALALMGGRQESVALLLEHGAATHETQPGKWLEDVVQQRSELRALLRKADGTVMHEAAESGDSAWLRAQLAEGRSADAGLDSRGRTVLMAACDGGRIECAGLLLDAGADPNAPGWFGRTALHIAASRGSAPIVELLLDRGARIDAREDCRVTPLFRAAEQPEAVSALLRRGAALGATEAARLGDSTALIRFLDAGTPPSLQEQGGYSLLGAAVLGGHGERV
jgi:ankyrin repeat protein